MNITLKQADVEEAIKRHLDAQGIVLAGRTFEAKFKSGRKGSGLTAQITLGLVPATLTAHLVEEAAAITEVAVQEKAPELVTEPVAVQVVTPPVDVFSAPVVEEKPVETTAPVSLFA